MKITIKTLQQKQFQIDAEGTDTIADLKAKVGVQQNLPIDNMKIIYSGKVLGDEKTIESCQIKEKDFLVLMVSKPKPTPVAAPAQSTSAAPAVAPAAPAPVTPAPAPVAAAPAPAAAAAAPAAAPAFGDSFVTGEALQTSINNMVDMGFPRADVLRALKASYNNPDRAVEYLMTGIPDHLVAESSAPAAAQPAAPAAAPVAAPAPVPAAAAPAAPAAPQNLFQLAQQQQGHPGGQPGGGAPAAGAGSALDRLGGAESMTEIREMVRQNPALLQPLIQQLVASNPELAQQINANPESFLQQLLASEEEDEGDAVGPGSHVLSVTVEERAAIERLEALGFPRRTVIEAYFACDKNEELAANYLFENGFED